MCAFNALKRAVSLLLALCTVILTLSVLPIKLDLHAADDTENYKSELWMKVDYTYMLNRGTRRRISNSSTDVKPYVYEDGKTLMIPATGLYPYTGEISPQNGGNTLTLTNGNDCYLFTVNSTEYKLNGITQPIRLKAPLIKKPGGFYYLSVEDLSKFYGINYFYNEYSGLIVFSKSTITYDNSYSSLAVQTQNIDELLYTFPASNDIMGMMQTAVGGDKVHPRLLCDSDRFLKLAAIYKSNASSLSDEDKTLREWINGYMADANAYLAKSFTYTSSSASWKSEAARISFRQPYFLYDENGNRLEGYYDSNKKYVPAYSYTYPGDSKPTTLLDVYDGSGGWNKSSVYGDGYDTGDRSNVGKYSIYLKYFAFAYQMTGENKWVDAFCLLARELADWQHWGEAHTLNLADGAVEFAIGYDWIYNGLTPAQRTEMAEILFLKAVEVADKCTSMKSSSSAPYWKYTSALDGSSRQLRQSGSGRTAWDTRTRTNNWQTVCTSGFVMSALAIMDEFPNNEAATAVCTGLIAKMLPCINNAMLEYAPDGSYLESPDYWGYSTNTFLRMILTLTNTLGTDCGFLDTVGLHDSFYFVMGTADTTFHSWGYHDSGPWRPKSEYFYCAARLFDDPNIAYFKDVLLQEQYGASPDIMDIICYSKDLSVGGGANSPLDYYGHNIETVTMRSSWNDYEGLFAGVHAGANVSAHSDADSGSFYLSWGGTIWFYDPGKEDYNIGNYFDNNYRYHYYRKSPVGHSTVLVLDKTQPDLKEYGQVLNTRDDGYAKVTKLHSETNGAFAYVDMKPQYGKYCTSARRALMLTQGREAIVLQDEITFSRATDIVWQGVVKDFDSITPDGKTAYLRNSTAAHGKKTLRISLVSPDDSLKFEYVTNELFVDGIKVKSEQLPAGSNPDGRLVIRASGKKSYKIAVAIEMIEGVERELFYTYTDSNNWKISAKKLMPELQETYTAEQLYEVINSAKTATTNSRKMLLLRQAVEMSQRLYEVNSTAKAALAELELLVTAQSELINKSNERLSRSFFDNLSALCGIRVDN